MLKKTAQKKASKKSTDKKVKATATKNNSKKTTIGSVSSKSSTVKQTSGERSTNYNVRDAVVKLRACKSTAAVKEFTIGEARITVKRAIQPVINRIENN